MNSRPPSLKAAYLCISGLFLAAATLESPAATISLHPTADTTLQSAYPDYNFGDGTTFTAGGRRQGGSARALLEFDIAGSLPAGAVINSASLMLFVVRVPSGGPASTFSLNRVLDAWGEGNGSDMSGAIGGAQQATWNNRLGPGSPWTTAGGDFASTISASKQISGFGSYVFGSTTTMVGDVQGWLDDPSSNFGWLLRSQSENSAATIRRFGARNDGGSSPILTIQYAIVPEPSIAALIFLSAALLWQKNAKLKQVIGDNSLS